MSFRRWIAVHRDALIAGLRGRAVLAATVGEELPVALDQLEVGSKTIELVCSLASDSFQRQLELDESIWRSLPFFAATYAFVAALIGRAAGDLPPLAQSAFPIATNYLLIAATFCLAWTMRWFVTVVRKRQYEIPADDAAILQYAYEMTAYHASTGLKGEAVDSKVVDELRIFMAGQYGDAARTNLRHNADRLLARSKVLLFLLFGFLLAFACEATIFVHKAMAVSVTAKEIAHGAPTARRPASAAATPPASHAPKGAADNRRRGVLGR